MAINVHGGHFHPQLFTYHVLDKLEKNNLYLKPEKYEFEKQEIE